MRVLDVLSRFIEAIPHQGRSLMVAYSGGLDSHVLLHGLYTLQSRLDFKLTACHIEHNIQPEAPQWRQHCQHVCYKLGIDLTWRRVTIEAHGQSLEEAAREQRYQQLAEVMEDNQVIMTAQHGDDQSETLLLQLLRGSGGRGMTGMARWKAFARGYLARPFLDASRADIEAYAAQHNLVWCEDPSNRDQRYDRNYLRNQVMPLLKQRWPQLNQSLGRFAENMAEEQAVLNQYLDNILSKAAPEPGVLDLEKLHGISAAEQRSLLRRWLQINEVRPPSRETIKRVQTEVISSEQDAQPQLKMNNAYQLRRYQNKLYSVTLLPPLPKTPINWTPKGDLTLSHGRLRIKSGVEGHLNLPADAEITVCFRQGGERCRLPNESFSRPLKKLFQQWGVPPWQRDYIPLIYYGSELAAVAGYCVCQPFYTDNNGLEVDFDWIYFN